MANRSAEEIIVDALRRARELSAVLTEADRLGIDIDVEIDRVPIRGQDDIIQVMIYPKNLLRPKASTI